MEQKPGAVNKVYFSTEEFPEVIGFCEKDSSSRVATVEEESYEYKLRGKRVYVVKKQTNRWEIIEFENDQVKRISTNIKLGIVLSQALTFVPSPTDNQESRVSILIPIDKKDSEKAQAIMYYLGGYPGNFLPPTPELTLIMDRFIDPNLTFLSYSYVPAEYIPWLNEELRSAGILGQDKSRTLLMYKK